MTYIGYIFSEKYRKKAELIQYWNNFHQYYIKELEYSKKPLSDIIERFNQTNEFTALLNNYKMQCIQIDISYITQEEKSELNKYISNLGRSDYKAQLEFYGYYTQLLREMVEQAIIKSKKYTDVYIKISFLIGLLFVILLI